MRKSQMSNHDLIKEYTSAVMQSTKYYDNKSYSQKEDLILKELCKRLDVDFEVIREEMKKF